MREKYIHTPGPWEVDSGMVQTVAEHKCKTPGCGVHIPIALMDRKPDNGTVPTERDANAYLIAASPELFDALKAMLAAYAPKADFSKPSELHSAVLAAKKAIDKVERYYL